jgi:hypothetical protein
MDSALLVIPEVQKTGSRLIQVLRDAGYDVSGAGLVRAEGDSQHYFYISSKTVDEKGASDGYRAIHSALKNEPGWIDRYDVRLIGATTSLSKGLSRVANADSTGKPGTLFQGESLGGVPIEGPAYIYPRSAAIQTQAAH